MMQNGKGVEVTPVNVIAPSIGATTGYLSKADNKTYMVGGSRPADGSLVQTQTGTYLMNNGSGTQVTHLVYQKNTNAINESANGSAITYGGTLVNSTRTGPLSYIPVGALFSLTQGLGAGVMETLSFGVSSRDLEQYFERDNETAYILGKIIANGALFVLGGGFAQASAGFGIITSVTGVGAVAGAGGVAFGGAVAMSSAAYLEYNISQLVDSISKSGSSSKPTQKEVLPKNARTTTNEKEVFKRLEQNHGIDPNLASERLHDIKKNAGRGPADNVVFDMTGNVYDPVTGEWLGSLTEGGAKVMP